MRQVKPLLSLLVLLTGCDISPFIGEDIKTDKCDQDSDGLARVSDHCGGNDCDDANPEVGVLTWYIDSDSDGYGGTQGGIVQCEPLAGYVSRDNDCDDADSHVNPDAREVCDGIDNDCDGAVDDKDDDIVRALHLFTDSDGDGYGDPSTLVLSCERVDTMVIIAGDCDDADPAVNPDAREVCNDGADNNCDGVVDTDATSMAWYRDQDRDGYGNWVFTAGSVVFDCAKPDGYAQQFGDCDDADPAVNPDAHETCNNGTDDNCDNTPDQCVLEGTYDLSTAETVLVGEAAYDLAVSDVNGDGAMDLVVGATDTTGSGAVYIFLGPLPTSEFSFADADTTLRGEQAGDSAGWSVAGVGDVNSDGFEDIAVGAPYEDSAGNDAGAVYILYGPLLTGDTSLANADLKLTGEKAGDNAGWSVAGAGDVNADGVDDMAVGAPYEDSAGSSAGAVYVMYGPLSTGDTSLADADLKLVGEMAGDNAGWSVAGVGDVNGDGVDDLAVGAPKESALRGSLYVLVGPTRTGVVSLTLSATKLTANQTGDSAGWSVAGAGDVNGDGMDDLVVGAPGDGTAAPSSGAAYVVFGPIAPGFRRFGSSESKLIGTATSDIYHGNVGGWSVAGGVDIDNDGVKDVLVGAPASGSTDNGGVVFAALGLMSPIEWSMSDSELQFFGETSGDGAGNSVAGGDVNGDGYDDVVIAASAADVVYVVYGLGN